MAAKNPHSAEFRGRIPAWLKNWLLRRSRNNPRNPRRNLSTEAWHALEKLHEIENPKANKKAQ